MSRGSEINPEPSITQQERERQMAYARLQREDDDEHNHNSISSISIASPRIQRPPRDEEYDGPTQSASPHEQDEEAKTEPQRHGLLGSNPARGSFAAVSPHGVTVVAPSSSPSQFLRCAKSRECHWILVLIFFGYLVVVPMVLALIFYLTWSEMLTSAVIAVAIPLVLYHLIWRHVLSLHPSISEPNASFKDASRTFFRVVSKHWLYEIYQLLLTLLSCSTYLFYTYHLSYVIDTASGRADYILNVPSLTEFVQVEYFLISSLSMDYLLRLMTVKHKWTHVLSLYSCIDLLCFTGVAYMNFFHANLAPKDAIYNYYLFQGPFRFLRMRRALKSLDAPIRSRSGLALYKLGPFMVSKKTAFFMLFTLRVILFIASAAALVLAFEFPCASFVTNISAVVCQGALQQFHLCLYFIIVTLSTVGYGDVTCATDAGRMLMCVVILYAIIQVPREIQSFSDLEADQRKAEEAMQVLQDAGIESNQGSQLELTMMLRSPSQNEQDVQEARDRTNSTGTADFSHMASPQPPKNSPKAHPPAFSSSPSTAATSGRNSLQKFLDDDTPFLCRWAEQQLRLRIARDPQLLVKLSEALGGEVQEAHSDDHKISAIVTALFSTAPRLPTLASPIVRDASL